ncbi:MAG: hypothetical protein V1767_00915 [Chloroflexota bacterium]
MIRMKSRLGPVSYATPGFTVVFGEADRIISAEVACSSESMLAVNDIIYSTRVTFATNTVTIRVYFADTSGAGPNVWTEIADLSDLSPFTFTVLADVE